MPESNPETKLIVTENKTSDSNPSLGAWIKSSKPTEWLTSIATTFGVLATFITGIFVVKSGIIDTKLREIAANTTLLKLEERDLEAKKVELKKEISLANQEKINAETETKKVKNDLNKLIVEKLSLTKRYEILIQDVINRLDKMDSLMEQMFEVQDKEIASLVAALGATIGKISWGAALKSKIQSSRHDLVDKLRDELTQLKLKIKNQDLAPPNPL